MRDRVPVQEPQRSLSETVEYGLTAFLVLVVIAALLEIFGVGVGVPF